MTHYPQYLSKNGLTVHGHQQNFTVVLFFYLNIKEPVLISTLQKELIHIMGLGSM